MPSTTLKLGEIEHVYRKDKLRLKTSSWAMISSPQLLSFPFSSLFKSLEELDSSGMWISRGHQLFIHFNFSFESIAFGVYNKSQVMENLGLVLCNAEMWNQLGLEASYGPSPTTFGSLPDTDEIVIRLTARNNLNLAHQHVPPEGVPSACLEELIFDLNFLGDLLAYKVAPKSDGSSSPSTSSHKSLQGGDEMLDQVVNGSQSSPAILQDALSDNTSQHIAELREMPMDSQQASDYQRPYDGYAIIEDIVKLLDVSLRTHISDIGLTKVSGLELVSSTEYPKLSEIAPAIFNPGYLEAIFHHSKYFHNIADSLDRIYRRTKSYTLKQKMEQFKDISPDRWQNCSVSNTEASEDTTLPLLAATKARLWFLTQKKLIDLSACRRLKKLEASECMYEEHLASEEMLDGEQGQSQDDEVESGLFSEDQDMSEEDNPQQQWLSERANEGHLIDSKLGFPLFEDDMLLDEYPLEGGLPEDGEEWSFAEKGAEDESLLDIDHSSVDDLLDL